MRSLTRVIDVFPDPGEFERTVDDILNSWADASVPILPTRVATQLGVPEVCIRDMITDERYGKTVERMYMTLLADLLEWIIMHDTKGTALQMIAQELFGWFDGCADFWRKKRAGEEKNASDMTLKELLSDVKNECSIHRPEPVAHPVSDRSNDPGAFDPDSDPDEPGRPGGDILC